MQCQRIHHEYAGKVQIRLVISWRCFIDFVFSFWTSKFVSCIFEHFVDNFNWLQFLSWELWRKLYIVKSVFNTQSRTYNTHQTPMQRIITRKKDEVFLEEVNVFRPFAMRIVITPVIVQFSEEHTAENVNLVLLLWLKFRE